MLKRFLHKVWKTFVGVLAVIGGIHLAVLLLIWALVGNTLLTIGSIERVGDTDLYTMEYHGDYGFDKFLKSGASTHQELLDFLVEELTYGLAENLDLGSFACSSFAARTPEDHPIMGRNLDTAHTPALLVTANPRGGYKSVSMVSMSFFGVSSEDPLDSISEKLAARGAVYLPVDGMNEKGLAVCVLQSSGTPADQTTDKADITTSTAIRLLLDKAATTEEAVELLGQYDMHSTNNVPYHFMIADAKGNSAVVEYVNNEMVVLWNQRVCTNFLLAPQDFSSGQGLNRYKIGTEAMEITGGVLSREEAMELLEAMRWTETSANATQWSCVYDLKSRTVDIVMHEDWENVHTFRISGFSFF